MQTPSVGDTDNVLLRKMLLNQSGAGGEVTSGGETVPYVIDYLGSGAAGSETFDDTNPHTGSWFCLHALDDAVIAAVTGNATNLAGKTISKGDSIFGRFTAITLTSGILTCYNI